MDRDISVRLLLPPQLRAFPVDLAAVLGVTVLTVIAVFVPVVRTTPSRLVFGIPFLFFVPGWVLLAAVFPENGSDTSTAPTLLERGILSVAFSLVVTPLVGLLSNISPWGLRLEPVFALLCLFVSVSTVIAFRRRMAIPSENRLRLSCRDWGRRLRAWLTGHSSTADTALTVLMVGSLLVAAVAVVFVLSVPTPGERYTELYLVTEQSDGTVAMDNYDAPFDTTSNVSLHVNVENHEASEQSYTLVVQGQTVRDENGSLVVTNRRESERYLLTLGSNESWRQQSPVLSYGTPDTDRIAYLLYRENPPSTPTAKTAYRSIQLSVPEITNETE